MTNELLQFIDFKTKQHIRVTGFDTKQVDARAKLKAAIAPMLRQWVAEAIEAGAKA